MKLYFNMKNIILLTGIIYLQGHVLDKGFMMVDDKIVRLKNSNLIVQKQGLYIIVKAK